MCADCSWVVATCYVLYQHASVIHSVVPSPTAALVGKVLQSVVSVRLVPQLLNQLIFDLDFCVFVGHNQTWNWVVTFHDPVTRESSDPETQLTR